MSNPLSGKAALVAAASRGNLIEKEWLMSGKLSSKSALITGISRGIGRAVALAFAREGAALIGVHSLATRMLLTPPSARSRPSDQKPSPSKRI